MSIITSSGKHHHNLKSTTDPKRYKEITDLYLNQLDKWITDHKAKLNFKYGRLTHLGVIDVYLSNENRKLELDFARTMIYFGRWESATLFKGQAIPGVELGMLWVIDNLLDLWHKYVENRDGRHDKVVGELFDIRRNVVCMTERYTNITMDGRQLYSLPAKTRRQPTHLYNLEVYDNPGEWGGVIFNPLSGDLWSDSDKRNLAEQLATDVGVERLTPGVPVRWHRSFEELQQNAEAIIKGREFMNLPEVRAALKMLRDRCAAQLNRFADGGAQLKMMDPPMKATAHDIAEEARQQSEMYAAKQKELDHFKATRAVGAVPAPPSLDEEIKRLEKELTIAKLHADTAQWKLKEQTSLNTIEALKPKIEYTSDEGKTKYTVTAIKDAEAAVNEVVINKAVTQDKIKEPLYVAYDLETGHWEKVGGPPNRDLMVDTPAELITMNMYQEYALLTANQDMKRGNQMMNAVLGLAGEAGEVADLLKKRFYHPWSSFHYKKMSEEKFLEHVIDEIGDVQWYLAWIAKLCKTTLGAVAKRNRAKLVARHNNGNPNENKS